MSQLDIQPAPRAAAELVEEKNDKDMHITSVEMELSNEQAKK